MLKMSSDHVYEVPEAVIYDEHIYKSIKQNINTEPNEIQNVSKDLKVLDEESRKSDLELYIEPIDIGNQYLELINDVSSTTDDKNISQIPEPGPKDTDNYLNNSLNKDANAKGSSIGKCVIHAHLKYLIGIGLGVFLIITVIVVAAVLTALSNPDELKNNVTINANLSTSTQDWPPQTTAATDTIISTESFETDGIGNKDFLALFLRNYLGARTLEFMISSNSSGWYNVTAPFLGMENAYNPLQIGDNHFTVPSSIELIPFAIEKKGILLRASTDVNVFTLNFHDQTSDAFRVIPIESLGNDYIIASTEPRYSGSFYNAQIGVVASMNDTIIEVNLRTTGSFLYNNKNYGNNDILKIELNELETFTIDHTHDLTGTFIKSTNPIAVMSGNVCNAFTSGCDHLSEMMPPVKSLSMEYIIPQIKYEHFNRNRLIRVTTVNNDTLINITRDGATQSLTLDHSETHDVTVGQNIFMYIRASKLLSIFVQSSNDGPFMMILPGIDRYLPRYMFAVPDDGFNNYIGIICKNSSVSSLQLDNAYINQACLSPTLNVNYIEYCQLIIKIDTGFHTIQSDKNDPFGLFLYGGRFREGYGFFVGMKYD